MAFALAAGAMGAALVGCSADADGGADGGEIVLTVSKRRSTVLPQALMDEMTNRHPNLRFEFDTYANGAYSTQQTWELEQHDIPDILINSRSQDVTEDLAGNLVDLAAYDFMSEYLPSVVDRLSIDGHVYYMPGYLTFFGFFYNEDMFAEHGWEAPQSLEDLVALNEKAKAEGIRLVSYSMELPGRRFMQLTNIAAAQFLHTPQGLEWEQRFFAGEATMGGTFEPFMDEYQTWIDSGLISAADIDLTAGEAEGMFESGEAAMYYSVGSAMSQDDCDFDLGQAPFLAKGNGEENGWYQYSTSAYYGINKELEKPGNEEKLAIALEMLEFMSTPEGQELLKEGGEGRYSATRGSDEGFRTPLLSEYYGVVDRNNLVEIPVYSPLLFPGGDALGEYLRGTVTAQEALRICDEAMLENKSETQMGGLLGHVDRDLSAEETVQYFADALCDYRGTDVALMLPASMSNGQYHVNGIAGKLYEGDVYANQLAVLLPYTNEKTTLATARISGSDLRALLDDGQVFVQDDWVGDDPQPFRYQVSGADVSYDGDGSVQSLTVDGREVEDDDEFTVAYFNGAVDGSRVSDAEVSDEQPIPAMTAYLKSRLADR